MQTGMRPWRWMLAVLTVLLLAACSPIVAPEGGAGPSATEEPAEETAEGTAGALAGVVWEWQRTTAADGTEVSAADPTRYTLTFMDDGSVGAQFDCNSGGGSYTVDGENMTLGPLATTLMACPEGSQDQEFAAGLNTVSTFAVDGDTLTLGLSDGGEMVFSAAGAAGEAAGEATAEPAEEATEEATEEPAEEATEEPAEEATPTPVAEEEATPEATEEPAEEPTEEATEEPAEEGAAPGENSLVGITWQWVETVYGDDSMVTVADPTRYTLTFMDDGSLAAQVDCNRGMGSFTTDGSSLTIGPLATTRMACPEDSQANVFLQDLERTATFVFDGPNLVLNMMLDSGNIYFEPAE